MNPKFPPEKKEFHKIKKKILKIIFFLPTNPKLVNPSMRLRFDIVSLRRRPTEESELST